MSEEKRQPDHADELVQKLFVITVLAAVGFIGVACYIIYM